MEMAEQPIAEDRNYVHGLQTTILRAKILKTTTTTEIDMKSLLRDLYTTLLQADPTTKLVSQDQGKIFHTVQDIPQDDTTFNTHFAIHLHLNHKNCGQVHLIFSVASDSTLYQWQQDANFSYYLQKARVRIYEHRFQTYNVKPVGIITHKSPTLTNRKTYLQDLQTEVL